MYTFSTDDEIKASRLNALGAFRVVESDTISGNISITGLEGDTNRVYKLFVHGRYTASTNLTLRFNNDSGNNYTRTIHQAGEYNNAEINSILRHTSQSGIDFPYGQYKNFFAEITIHAKSGGVRLVHIDCVVYDDDDYFLTNTIMGAWINTADELTRIDLVANDTFDDGYYYLLELNTDAPD